MSFKRMAYELAETLALANVSEVPEVVITFPTLSARFHFQQQLKQDLSPEDLSRQVLFGDFDKIEFHGITIHIKAVEKHAVS